MSRILVADDDSITRMLIAEILAEGGYDVTEASTGDQALEVLGRGEVRLVLADWEMPGVSGPELCAAIRSRDGGAYTYVILVTGRDARADLIRGLSSGADDYVVKPVDPTELLLRVRAVERVVASAGRDLALFALAKLADSRDPETGAHLERTQAYCRVLAEALLERHTVGGRRPQDPEVDRGFVEMIVRTSPLHDIGKIGIPDAVLLKAGRLSDAEYEVMKRHTTIGADTLDAALERFPGAAFLSMARDIAACHHERWDGSGYPAGVRGYDIPLAARLMAVADVYDALRSQRVYKPAFDHEKARQIIADGAGSHFDPLVVELFEANHEVFDAINTERQLRSPGVDAVADLGRYAA